LWQLAVIFSRYRFFTVNTFISQSVEGEITTLPVVTICHLKAPTTTPHVDLNNVEIMFIALNTTIIESDEFKTYMDEYFPTIGDINDVFDLAYLIIQSDPNTIFFHNFIQTNYSLSSKNSPIIDCAFINWDYSENEKSNCLTSIYPIWDPDYAFCYTMRVNNS